MVFSMAAWQAAGAHDPGSGCGEQVQADRRPTMLSMNSAGLGVGQEKTIQNSVAFKTGLGALTL
jgi:hypothetical protein